jgi:hypothetical protein
VNVAFLLLTTAVGAGADPAPAQPANAPAVVAPATAPATCGCGAEIVDHHAKSSFFDRFRRSKHHDCCDTCNSCAPAAPAPCCKPAPAPTCDTCGDSCHGKSSFLDRCRGLFSRKSHGCCDSGCDSCGGCGSAAVAPAALVPAPQTEQLKKMPKGENEGKKIETGPKPLIKNETETKNPFELDRRYVQRAGRAADFSNLTGQLFYAHTDGGVWVLRYAPLDKEDAYGGGVVLARDRSMNEFHEGDLVTIEGQVIAAKWSTHLGGPLYQIRTMSLVDRSHP